MRYRIKKLGASHHWQIVVGPHNDAVQCYTQGGYRPAKFETQEAAESFAKMNELPLAPTRIIVENPWHSGFACVVTRDNPQNRQEVRDYTAALLKALKDTE